MPNTLELEIPVFLTLLEGSDNSRKLLDHLTVDSFTDPRLRELFVAVSAYAAKHGMPTVDDLAMMPQCSKLDGFTLIDNRGQYGPYKPIKTNSGINAALEQLEANKANQKFNEMLGERLKVLADAEDKGQSAQDIYEHITKFKEDLDSLTTEGTVELSKPEQIRVLLDKSYSKKLTYEAVRKEMKITGKELGLIAMREEKKAEPQWMRERLPNGKFTRNLVLVKGLSMMTTMEHGSSTILKENSAYLPADLHRWIARGSKSLDQHSMVGVAAQSDGMKSNFLIDCAVANARKGLKVLMLNFESDTPRLHANVASRIMGYRVWDVDEVNAIWKRTKWLKNLDVKQIRTCIDLSELCRSIKTMQFDVVIIDYLATHFLSVDKASQASVPATIVQTLGVELVDEGIPVFFAVQGTMEKGVLKYPETWIHRCTLSFVMADIERSNEDRGTHRVTYHIRKNKHGGANEMIDMFYDEDVLNVDHSVPISYSDFGIRNKVKAKKEDEKAKEAQAEAKKQRDAEKRAAKGNGKEPEEVEGAARLPTSEELDDDSIDHWKPDADALVAEAGTGGRMT